MCAKYHDPSSSGSPDILLTRFHRFTMHKSEREINQPNTCTYRILSKVNQDIYTLDKICVPNIMILAQAVLQIFC